MTLALLYSNPRFVTIAVDRRITTGTGRLIDDGFTKTAVLFNKFLVTFTGLAELGPNKHSIQWFVETAAKYPNRFAAEEIAYEATREMKKVRASPRDKRLSFVGVGYDEIGRVNYALISNMHSDDLDVVDEARGAFTFTFSRPIEVARATAIGTQPPPSAVANLMARLTSSHPHRLPSINSVENILAAGIAASAGKSISQTSLVTSLRSDRAGARFHVVTPGSRPGQTVDIASPYVLHSNGSISVMANRQIRRAHRVKGV